MQKILIISYFSPPCNLTASQRAYSWAKYLHKYGYFPVIITRRWDKRINCLKDISEKTSPEILKEKRPDCEIHYLPYKSNLRDRIYVRYGDKKYTFFRKILSFIELTFQNICNNIIPYSNIYSYTLNYINENPDIKKIIITGNPFILFKFGYLLNKKLGTKWIADYRDAWTTSEINISNKGLLHKFLTRIERYFEKRWVGTASYITSSSQPLADGISEYTGVSGYALYNGYEPADFENIRNIKPYDDFTISYIGTLYPGQQIEIFCEAFKKLINTVNNPKIKLLFPGLAFYKDQADRIIDLLKGYEEYYEITERTDRNKILESEVKSHLFLHVAWKGYKGVVASKIYEYIASGSYILVTPSDNGVIEEIVRSSECGTITNNADDTYNFLLSLYEKYLKGIKITNDVEKDCVKQFSREEQVKKLSNILSEI